jgi:aspartyl-tRNA(Asn)/glutamyl-tRNA(Gln) amidotransferase subunit B
MLIFVPNAKCSLTMLTYEQAKQKYELVVGLEVHAQMLTQSKAYSSDSTEYGNMPNTNISVITLAHPGTLPKFNKKVAEYAIKMGLACHCNITEYNTFDRKNYFYPDLPKGYQITQDKTPICRGGYVAVKTKNGVETHVKLNRIHMEEDAGKSMHLAEETETLVDLNRAGVPLIEIVTEPDIREPEEAYAYLTEIRKLVRYLEICDGNMEEGSLRCDANISIRLHGESKYGRKVEVKNMNSIRNVQRAIEHEFMRQVEMFEAGEGENIVSETRMFDASTGITHSLRSKEALNDYRYFPEPDLQPFVVSQEYLKSIKAAMPPLPNFLKEKFITKYGLPEYDALVLTDTKEIALWFEELCSQTKNYKAASNWMMGNVKSYLNELNLPISQFPLSATQIAEIIDLIEQNKLSSSTASQKLFPAMLESPKETATDIAKKLDLLQDSSDDLIVPLIAATLAKYPEKVQEYKNGKKGLLGLFVGEVMKNSKGKADPKKVNELVVAALG